MCYVCIHSECSDRCSSCLRDHPDNCTSCRYLVNHTNHNDCLENTSCAMLGFEVGKSGCGELMCVSTFKHHINAEVSSYLTLVYAYNYTCYFAYLLAECPEGHYLLPNESEAYDQCQQTNEGPRYLLPNEEIVFLCVNQCSYNSTIMDGDNFCYGKMHYHSFDG